MRLDGEFVGGEDAGDQGEDFQLTGGQRLESGPLGETLLADLCVLALKNSCSSVALALPL